MGKANKKTRNKVSKGFRFVKEKPNEMQMNDWAQLMAGDWLAQQMEALKGEETRQHLSGNLRWNRQDGLIELLLGNLLAVRVLLLEVLKGVGVARGMTEEEIGRMKGESEDGIAAKSDAGVDSGNDQSSGRDRSGGDGEGVGVGTGGGEVGEDGGSEQGSGSAHDIV